MGSVRFFVLQAPETFPSFVLLESGYAVLHPTWLCNVGKLINFSVSQSSLLKKVIAPTSEGGRGS